MTADLEFGIVQPQRIVFSPATETRIEAESEDENLS